MRTLANSRFNQTVIRVREGASNALREFKAFFTEPPSYEFAVAGVGAIRLPEVDDPKKAGIMHFDTGEAPPKKSIGYAVSHWESLGVLPPGKTPEPTKRYMTFKQAQEELSRVLKQPTATHEYLAYEAAKLLGADAAVLTHTVHLVDGAGAEDFIFMTGENLDNVCLTDPARRNTKNPTVQQALKEMKHTQTTFLGVLFHIVSVLGRFFTGNRADLDALNRPYFAHFYNGNHGLDMASGELKFQSALDRIKRYWDFASIYYRQGDMPNAFTSLGHMMHLIQDLHAPAHVHNDTHGPGNRDSLEGWLTRTDYPHLARLPKEANVRIWSSKTCAPPSADQTWTPSNITEKLTGFVDGIVASTQRFRSVDAHGTSEGQKRTGKLSDGECYEQANVLIPLAIVDSAKIVAQFLDYHRRVYPGNKGKVEVPRVA